MGHRIGGTFNTTSSKMWFCIGFVPDWVRIVGQQNSGTVPDTMEWTRAMQGSVLNSEGIGRLEDGAAVEDYPVTKGIQTYHGGEMLTSGAGTLGVGTTTFGSTSAVYLKPDDGGDYRFYSTNKANRLGDAVAVDITTWTKSVTGGYFNEDVIGVYIGEGSLIIINGRRYSITKLAASAGEAESSGTGEVLLSHTNVSSGKVEYIGGMYTMKSLIAGEITPAGFTLAAGSTDDAAELNVTAGERCGFEAGTWDI